jgi:predicted metal-dependent HD superfamily phosphohydrolase
MEQAEWIRAVRSLGGDGQVAARAATDLTACYAEPHRRYHDRTHLHAVLRDSATLAGALRLPDPERAVLTAAVCAHDVVYAARPGDDERRSAAWARDRLAGAGVAEAYVARVERLVLATLEHAAPPGDLTAAALLDADLAILGAGRRAYDRYRAAVRAEYAAYDDRAWRRGRARVMSALAERDPLYATAPGRDRWEAAAKANIARELASLR